MATRLVRIKCISLPSLTFGRRCYSSVARSIRNCAVIAHVDHGKTTLVDQLLRQSGMTLVGDRVMDSISLEKERGITIMSKNTSLQWGGHQLNIVDTPGHQDFGGEVERVLSMVDGVLLVVDATEGPMTQTKFVLAKALQQNLRPLVVINKVDRDTARLNGEVEDELFELFMALNASDEQLDFPVLYASAKYGWCVRSLEDERKDCSALFEAIVAQVPPPRVSAEPAFSMLVTSMEHDNYLGKIITGKVHSGMSKVGTKVRALTREGVVRVEAAAVTKVFRRYGVAREEIACAEAGDIISISGIDASVTDTVCEPALSVPLPAIPIDPPTISMTFSVNDSPLKGKSGTKLTSNMIKDRLLKECENNVTLQVKPSAHSDSFDVQGRGELQLGILIEQMRREGFELTLSPPRVLLQEPTDGGPVMEPWEELSVDVGSEYSGLIINTLQNRGGELINFKQDDLGARLLFRISSRGLMGFRSEIKAATSGSAVINSTFDSYRPLQAVPSLRKGMLFSSADGVVTAYALRDLEARGEMFVSPGDLVYRGMVVGEHNRDSSLEINPTKTKKLTNMRAAGNDEGIRLSPPRAMSLEDIIAYVAGNEQLQIEITPEIVRLRQSPHAKK